MTPPTVLDLLHLRVHFRSGRFELRVGMRTPSDEFVPGKLVNIL